jgi:hypothetical protein
MAVPSQTFRSNVCIQHTHVLGVPNAVMAHQAQLLLTYLQQAQLLKACLQSPAVYACPAVQVRFLCNLEFANGSSQLCMDGSPDLIERFVHWLLRTSCQCHTVSGHDKPD